MVNSNQEVKPNFQLRALELLLYIPLDKSWGAQLSSYWQVWMMQKMNSKCNESKSISASKRDK